MKEKKIYKFYRIWYGWRFNNCLGLIGEHWFLNEGLTQISYDFLDNIDSAPKTTFYKRIIKKNGKISWEKTKQNQYFVMPLELIPNSLKLSIIGLKEREVLSFGLKEFYSKNINIKKVTPFVEQMTYSLCRERHLPQQMILRTPV